MNGVIPLLEKKATTKEDKHKIQKFVSFLFCLKLNELWVSNSGYLPNHLFIETLGNILSLSSIKIFADNTLSIE
jgi:hypothetical protein